MCPEKMHVPYDDEELTEELVNELIAENSKVPDDVDRYGRPFRACKNCRTFYYETP